MGRGRRKESETHIRRLQKMGAYTYYVTIPKKDIDRLGWQDKQHILVQRKGARVVLMGKNNFQNKKSVSKKELPYV